MTTRAKYKPLPAVALLLLATTQAGADEFAESVIPPASTERFLGQVRDYGDGRPSPNILYSTRGIGEAANSPGRTITQGSSVTSLGAPPPNKPLGGSTLQGGGTLERRTVTPYAIQGGTLEQRTVTPYAVTSPWR